MSKDFKKYIDSYQIGWLIATILTAPLVLLSIVKLLMGDADVIVAMILFGVPLAFALTFLWRTLRLHKDLRAEGLAEQVEADFRQAASMRKDKVRFGQRWIYPKHSSRIVRYEEITRIYQYIHKTNMMEDNRALKYVDAKGKHRKLCNLELKDASRDELHQMMSIILAKNPSVQVGYQK